MLRAKQQISLSLQLLLSSLSSSTCFFSTQLYFQFVAVYEHLSSLAAFSTPNYQPTLLMDGPAGLDGHNQATL